MRAEASSHLSDAKSLGTQATGHTTVLHTTPYSLGETIDQNEDQGIPSEKEKEAARSDVIYVEWEKDDPENPFNWPIRKVRKLEMMFAGNALTKYRSILSLRSLSR